MTHSTGSSTNILAIVNSTIELPTMPEVLLKLNEVMANPDSSAADVAKVISADPAVATNILRIVNSAYYGLQVRVSSVSLAISVMGFNMTKKLALKAAVFSAFGKRREKIQHFDPLAFWRHAVFTGIAARTIASVSAVFADMHPEDAYITGLLHDIGKIILFEKCAPKYLAVLRKAAGERRADVEVEGEDLGFTHADVGSVLAIKWSLPEDLAIAIRYHHAPAKDPFHRSLSSLIHVADHLAWSASHPSTVGTPPPTLDTDVYGHIGLTPDMVEELLPQVLEDFNASELPW
ncbi:MAG: HDOD domain-containing protein [Planctomycetes bacterium]|nr:HDOD domain-containing protein [Planctomycetota bacterium]MBZ0150108.1 HDOD domain-containing protein [Planctomycetota bacterium]MCC7396528.1 HDOD domain-containing protein [Planctomycetota bacterium]